MMKEKKTKNEYKTKLQDVDGVNKIPVETWLATGIISISVIIAGVFSYVEYSRYGYSVGGIVIYTCCAIGGLILSIRFIKDKIQKRIFWENSIAMKMFKTIEYIKEGYRNSNGKIMNMFFAKMTLLSVAIAYVGYQVIIHLYWKSSIVMNYFYLNLWAVIISILVILVTIRIGADVNVIAKARKELYKGNFDHSIDVTLIIWPLKKSANDLNSIGVAIGVAVEDKLKSERLKTTLLTNVSHDIKTPLTSIINYTNLMNDEKTKSKKMAEYIEVLLRQSNKLKKLTEDLIDASKATSGVMEVNLMEMDVETILTQIVGEYKEKLEEAGLEVILSAPQKSAKIMCDDRLITRVLENLFSNICKYSMEGTRVYINSIVKDKRVYMSFKNISKIPLNITPEELKERFIRGDESRTEEGNGLGLNIADNFTKIQNGILDIEIDGDLFKATLSFVTEA